ncbi:Mor transcription activator family protein [Pseudomonas sp. 273]|uniref:Mor transcription activator family protein n=1 Tax=Pseudomonas sp. 273 TaxID=75692 RepID=UPI0023D87553|nr:Mor transcription activator family protein [Pseudomonas sp. 273]
MTILAEHGIATDLAEQVGHALADHIANQWRGTTLYIPSDYRHQITKRDLQILAEFNGRNHHALARKYGLVPSTIYKLLKRTQDRKFERDQGKLDLGDGLP